MNGVAPEKNHYKDFFEVTENQRNSDRSQMICPG